MADDDLRFRISAEADDAIRATEQASQAQQQLARDTDDAGQVSEQAARRHTGLGSTIGRLSRSVMGMVSSWLSFTAVAGTVVALLRSIAQESREALQEIVALGAALRDLAVNLGENADMIHKHANAISRTRAHRQSLIDFATEMTDHRPELAAEPESLQDLMSRAAPVAMVTGETGDQIARVMLALADAGFQRPEDAAAMFMTGPLQGQDIERILQRGGRQALELTQAMIGTGTVDPRRARRQLPQLFDALTETDAEGRPVEDLRGLGITADQDITQRLRRIVQATRSEDPAMRALAHDVAGANIIREFLPAMSRAIAEGGTLEQVREDVQHVTAEQLQERMLQSEAVRLSLAQEELEFRQQLRRERPERAALESARERARDRMERAARERGWRDVARHAVRFGGETMMSLGVSPERIAPEQEAEPRQLRPFVDDPSMDIGHLPERAQITIEMLRNEREGMGADTRPSINNITTINGDIFRNADDPETEDLEMTPQR